MPPAFATFVAPSAAEPTGGHTPVEWVPQVAEQPQAAEPPLQLLSPQASVAFVSPQPGDVRAPETLHPALWLGHQLGRHVDAAVPSEFAVLDAQLPGGGWPRRVLTELLLPHPGVGEIRLLAPSLAATQRSGRLVMVFDPPAQLSAQALAALGFDVSALLVINTRSRVIPGTDSLWALEQALKSGHVGAVLAWLPPRLGAERLRRLQIAAQAHDGPAFVMREVEAQQRPTAAPLRLGLRPGGADVLSVSVLKRRGPPLPMPLRLDLPPVLSVAARGRAGRGLVERPDPMNGDGMGSGGVNSDGISSELVNSKPLYAATFVNLASS